MTTLTLLQPELLQDWLVKTQEYIHSYAPKTKANVDTSSRHGPTGGQKPERYMFYKLSEDMQMELACLQKASSKWRDSLPAWECDYRESISTTHHVYAWHQNGHRELVSIFTPFNFADCPRSKT